MKTANIGTVSHGTLRSEDLLSSFISELEGLLLLNGYHFSLPENFSERDRLNNLIGEAQDCFDENGQDIAEDKEERASELIADLMDALSIFAPQGCAFGAHEGDGSDFGFWPVDQDEEREQPDASEPILDNPGYKPCNCEDYPCCGH